MITRTTLDKIPKEGSAFPERTCCWVLATSNGFTRKEPSAPAVAPQMKLLAGRGRSKGFTMVLICSKLHINSSRRQTLASGMQKKKYLAGSSYTRLSRDKVDHEYELPLQHGELHQVIHQAFYLVNKPHSKPGLCLCL